MIAGTIGVVFERVQHVRRVKIVYPMEILRFPVIPGVITPLVLGRVLQGSGRQGTVGLVSFVCPATSQEASGESIGVVNAKVLFRKITDANGLTIGKLAEIMKNVLAGAHRNVEKSVPVKMFVGVQGRVTDEGSPDYRRQALGYKRATRLVIEMVGPARTGVPGSLVLPQPFECMLSLIAPGRVSGSFVKTYETSRKKAHTFGGTALRDS